MPNEPKDPTTRDMCALANRKSEEQGVLVGARTPSAIVGALLEHMPATAVLTLLLSAVHTTRAIINDECNTNVTNQEIDHEQDAGQADSHATRIDDDARRRGHRRRV